MKLVEKHIISRNHECYSEIDNLAFLSKNLYNRANYIIRQEFINTSREKEAGQLEHANWIRYHEIQGMLQSAKEVDYMALPRKVSQQILILLDKNWKSFFAAMREWKTTPDKFLGRPCLPKYKEKTKGRNILIYTIQAISKPLLKEGIVKPSGTNIRIKTFQNNVQQTRIIPLRNKAYKFEIIYEKELSDRKSDKSKIAGIDIGLNNLATVTSNVKEFSPLIINGRPLKSMNQYFNKKRAMLMSFIGEKKSSNRIEKLTHKRNCKVDDYMHKASRDIVNRLVKMNIGILIIGKNDGWKNEINIGKRNNQNFVNIPHAKFANMLKYKAELENIKVILREESHTSKCSFIDKEPIRHRDNYVGKRIKRGLFRSAKGILINADCNGSGNIIRKEIPNAFADGIEGVVVRPVRITPRGFYPCKLVS